MLSFLQKIFDSSEFSPHGLCLLWEPELVWLHVISDAVIAAAYFSIPFALAFVVSKRRDFQFGWVAWSFAIFILACGLTHVFSIYTLWVPVYGLEGIAKALTAIASLTTAIMLWPLIPKVLVIPTTEQLREAHIALEEEGRHRQQSDMLLQRFREAEATENQIRQAQKMEAVGQLTGGVAHDFNNILTVIMGFAEILSEELQNHPELVRSAKLIMEAAERGASLTRHLLAFARRQPLQPRDVDVNTLVANAINFLRPTIGASIDIEARRSEIPVVAFVDSNQLTTALVNLALNSRDAMPGGGTLLIKTETVRLEPDEAQAFDGLAAGAYIAISVKDTGRGIAAQDLGKVFEPFFTTKEVGKGTGLGLSMVYGFVKQSNGHIGIESREGSGTTVKILLPAGISSVEPSMNAKVGSQAIVGRGTILVAEDDPLIRAYVLAQIEGLGYEAISASDGEEALVILRGASHIDLLFTDVIMPGSVNGYALSVEALKLQPTLKILFTTGYAENILPHGSQAPANIRVLAKPYSRADLAAMIRKAMSASHD